MINYIWAGMLLIGLVYAALNGTMSEVTEGVFTGAKEAVAICIGLISVLTFWLGLMKVAETAGILKQLAKLVHPLARRVFPEVPKDHPAMGYILSNLTANVFGLGNAATPMGIKAMEELKRLNGGKDEASRSMITLLALNTACLTLVPTTVISIRMSYESEAPTDIVSTTIFASGCAMIGAICIDRFFYYLRSRKERSS
ncbi:spore maturation protein A [Bacillus sp. JCM 19047]|uniref:Nucleoside recognition domain-containing protein n=3 Tax=Bacillaceae TaxID=186817 RepID=A0ABY7W6Y6_9BACI|nr:MULTISPECIES: nucleoside recognition domain-containing protein [Shouchella]MED4127128.1 nucleoside recognition domain-containing protein [Shouchella miscanthi]WDF03612.1 nucleoside recognition domain-containing protein [Shouchella hunanensis]GAF23363.1 spore maturation protein A [Bacillus sp. JCM 19047]